MRNYCSNYKHSSCERKHITRERQLEINVGGTCSKKDKNHVRLWGRGTLDAKKICFRT